MKRFSSGFRENGKEKKYKSNEGSKNIKDAAVKAITDAPGKSESKNPGLQLAIWGIVGSLLDLQLVLPTAVIENL